MGKQRQLHQGLLPYRSWGGPRSGAGRKPKRGAARTVPLTVWVTKEDHELLGDLANQVREDPALAAYDVLAPALRKATAKRRGKKTPEGSDER